METIKGIQEEIIGEFEIFENWMQKYEYLIDLGKELSMLDKNHKIDEIFESATVNFGISKPITY